jgi:hypothetical protein
MERENKPLYIFQKNAEKIHNRIIIPKFIIKKFGYSYYMEIYKDRIVLIPIEKEGE